MGIPGLADAVGPACGRIKRGDLVLYIEVACKGEIKKLVCFWDVSAQKVPLDIVARATYPDATERNQVVFPALVRVPTALLPPLTPDASPAAL